MSSAKFPKIRSFDWFEFFPFFLLDFLLIISKFLVYLVIKVLNHLQLEKFETTYFCDHLSSSRVGKIVLNIEVSLNHA